MISKRRKSVAERLGRERIDNLGEYIVDKCYHTGSRVFGVPNKDSDYDYICTADIYDNIINKLKSSDINFRDGLYFKSIYVNVNRKNINLICLNRIDYDAWVLATETVISMCEHNMRVLVKHKTDRVTLFESLRVCFKLLYTKDHRSEKNKINTPEFVKTLIDQRKLIGKIDNLIG